jgi:hypothetical protein
VVRPVLRRQIREELRRRFEPRINDTTVNTTMRDVVSSQWMDDSGSAWPSRQAALYTASGVLFLAALMVCLEFRHSHLFTRAMFGTTAFVVSLIVGGVSLLVRVRWPRIGNVLAGLALVFFVMQGCSLR